MTSTTTDLTVVHDASSVGERGAEVFSSTLEKSLERGSRFVVALSGGTTARHLHAALRERRDRIPWEKIHFLFSDERAVPSGHVASNYHMAKETLFDPLSIDDRCVSRIEADDGDHVRAAQEYSRLLVAEFQSSIDLVVLGMGADGHTASLFPGMARDPREAPVIPTFAPPETGVVKRVSFSLTQLVRAKLALVLVTGTSKAERLRQVMKERGQLPLQQVMFHRALARRPTILFADEEAGQLVQP